VPRTNLLTAHPHHRTRSAPDDIVAASLGVGASPVLPDWYDISQLVAAGDAEGRALLSDDPGLGHAGQPARRCVRPRSRRDDETAHRPAAFLLIETAEPLMVRQPASGRTDDLQVELLILRGFRRFRPGTPVPAPNSGWALTNPPGRLELRDNASNKWAQVRTSPSARWLAAAGRDGHVVVLYGGWLGVGTPCGVRESQYGPAQRAAELRAARIRGQVAVAAVPWRG
jgi:hypothetical protein